MKFLILLCYICAIAVVAKKTPKESKKSEKAHECEGVLVNHKLHRRHVLMNGLNRAYQLAIYNHEHQVFFSQNIGQDTQDTFEIDFVKPNDTMPTPVHHIKNGFAMAINQDSKIIYFGGSEGIYNASLTNIEEVKHMIKDVDVWDLFYHNHHLYYVDFPNQHLHKYDLKEKKEVEHKHTISENILQFVIDGEGDVYITTVKGLFEIKKGSTETIPYEGPKNFRAAAVNHKGVAHFAARGGIFVAHKNNHTMSEIVSIKNVFGLTFDAEDNIIYSNPHELVKLVPKECN